MAMHFKIKPSWSVHFWLPYHCLETRTAATTCGTEAGHPCFLGSSVPDIKVSFSVALPLPSRENTASSALPLEGIGRRLLFILESGQATTANIPVLKKCAKNSLTSIMGKERAGLFTSHVEDGEGQGGTAGKAKSNWKTNKQPCTLYYCFQARWGQERHVPPLHNPKQASFSLAMPRRQYFPWNLDPYKSCSPKNIQREREREFLALMLSTEGIFQPHRVVVKIKLKG